jgi:glutamate/tyrosine decarboxylase-like PLP-dependent enzyme
LSDFLEVDLKPAQFRAVSKETTEMLLELFRDIDSARVFPGRKPAEIQDLLSEPLPIRPQDPVKIIKEVREKVIPNITRIGSPRYFGFVNGSGTMMSVFGDAIAAAINPNVGAWKSSSGATELERLVIKWFAEMIGYDPKTGGLLTSGGTVANMTAIATALHDKAGYDIANEGLQSENRKGRFLLYMSDHEGHSSVIKAAQVLGLGRNSVRRVKSNDDFKMDTENLEELIERDAKEGNVPFCVVGQVGSINVGVVDPLREISRICTRHNLWFHADGACGAFGRIIPRKAKLFEGLELADSVTLDPHKWLYISYECGCVLGLPGVWAADVEGVQGAQGLDVVEAHRGGEVQTAAGKGRRARRVPRSTGQE